MVKKGKKVGREPPNEIFLPPEPINPAFQQDEWRKAHLDDLPEGITLVPNGKSANIYIRRGHRVIDIYCELAGSAAYDVVVYTDTIYEVDVDTFEFRLLVEDEKKQVVDELRAWLDARGTRYSV